MKNDAGPAGPPRPGAGATGRPCAGAPAGRLLRRLGERHERPERGERDRRQNVLHPAHLVIPPKSETPSVVSVYVNSLPASESVYASGW